MSKSLLINRAGEEKINNFGSIIVIAEYKTREAFQVYKNYKEKHIKQIADQYKSLIPEKLYNAMYEYEVEIDN